MFTTHQFLIYKLVDGKKAGKKDKIPCCPHTLKFGVNPLDSQYHTDYNTAHLLAQTCGDEYGVGFVFTKEDPYFFIDIDGAVTNGQWSELSVSLCQMFPNAYIEVSQSGNGAHIIGRYTGIAPAHSCKNEPLGLECYTSDRFVALTGNGVTGDAETDHTQSLNSAINQYFPPSVAPPNSIDWRDTPVDKWCGPEDDKALIDLALTSKSANNAFNGKASFKDLWTNNIPVLADSYPSDTDDYNRSQADSALAQHLAFWTGNNHARVERLMRESALVRDKWDDHKSYLAQRTITRAVNQQQDVYYSKKYDSKPVEYTPVETVPTPSQEIASQPIQTVGDQFMTAQQQFEYFKGCVYIRDIHKIWIPDGSFLKPEQFKASFGGYIFAIDGNNQKVTKNAWEAFVESQAIRFPKVSRTVFRPEVDSGMIFEEEGLTYVNTYTPIITPRKKGDSSKFLTHLAKVLPDTNDQLIMLSYMAACVQYPGVKFQWCPLIQGAEGNGKTLFTRCVSYAVGQRYTHLPNAKELGEGGSKFTTWIQNKLFIGVEEIYVSDRKEVSEALKVFITNDRIEIQGKGVDQVMGDNRANFMMNSNHKDALHVSLDTRRYSVFYSAQQCSQDLIRDGMDEQYFSDLYNWLKNEDGYAIVNEFLHTYQIPAQYNPADKCQRAPSTSSTVEAVTLSVGPIEQEVLEAINEGRPGFNNGWISSKAFDSLLKDLHAERKIPINKRRALLNSLGYDWHPYLTEGRVNNIVPHEGGKPRLFTRISHIINNIQAPAEILAQYCKDQGYAGFHGIKNHG